MAAAVPDGGDHSRQGGDRQCDRQRIEDHVVLEELPVPVQGKAGPHRLALGGVEGKDHQDQDGGVEEKKNQEHKQAADESVFLHRTVTPSSPSPKRFITAIQTRTMTIITRDMAEPRWGL